MPYTLYGYIGWYYNAVITSIVSNVFNEVIAYAFKRFFTDI